MRKIISFVLGFILIINCIPAFGKEDINIIKDGYNIKDYVYSADFINSLENTVDPDISYEDYIHYKSFKGIHPRMFVDANKVEHIIANSKEGGSYYHMYNRVVSRADYATLSKMPGWPEDGKNTTSLHRDVGEKLSALAVGYLLTGDEKYYNGSENGYYDIYQGIREACVTYPSWGVEQYNNDLVFDHISIGLSMVWDYCQDILTAEDKELIISTVKERMKYAIEKTYSGGNSNYGHNHSHLNRAALCVIGLAMFEELDNVDSWMEENVHFLTLSVKTFSPDGSYHEGIMYQMYAMQYVMPVLHLFKKFHNIDAVSESDYFKNLKHYISATTSVKDANTQILVPFNNSTKHLLSGHQSALFYMLADWYNDKEYQSIANWITPYDVYRSGNSAWYDIFFYNPELNSDYDFTKDYSTTSYFENGEIITSRYNWEFESPLFAAKCNPPLGHFLTQANEKYGLKMGSGHAEPDVNHFTLLGYGGEYLFYDDLDYGYGNTVTYQHNTLMIDGAGQKGETTSQFMGSLVYSYMSGYNENPHFEKIIEGEDYIYAVGVGASAYPKELKVEKFNRHFLYIKPGILIILDDIKLSEKREMTIRYLPYNQEILEFGEHFLSFGTENKMQIFSLNTDDTVSVDSSVKKLINNYSTNTTVEKRTIDYIKKGSEWVNAVGISFLPSSSSDMPQNINCSKTEKGYAFSIGNAVYEINTDNMNIIVNKVKGDYPVNINGLAFIQKNENTFMYNDRMYAGYKEFLECMGIDIKWFENSSVLRMTCNDKILDADYKNSIFKDKDGNILSTEDKPLIINGDMVLPLRFITEYFEGLIAWSDEYRTVDIIFNVPDIGVYTSSELGNIFVNGKTIAGFKEGIFEYSAYKNLEKTVIMPLLLSKQTKYTMEQYDDKAVIKVKNILTNTESVYNITLNNVVGLGNSGIIGVESTVDKERKNYTVDGNMETYWACPIVGGEIVYELDKSYKINGVSIAFQSGTKRQALFDLYKSDDGINFEKFYEGVSSGNNDTGEIFEFEPVEAKFIKFYSKGSNVGSYNTIMEIGFLSEEK